MTLEMVDDAAQSEARIERMKDHILRQVGVANPEHAALGETYQALRRAVAAYEELLMVPPELRVRPPPPRG